MAYVYEFLWRGRPGSSGDLPAWHVIIAEDGVDAFNQPTHAEKCYNMKQAAEAGWDLSVIESSINAAALLEIERLRAVVAQYQIKGEVTAEDIAGIEVTDIPDDELSLWQRFQNFVVGK